MQEPIERRKEYRKRKKENLCPRCGKKKRKNSKFSYCDECREYYRDYNRDIAEDTKKARRSKYALRKAKFCCPRCGVFVGKRAKKIICEKCLDKQYLYNTGQKRPRKLRNK